jgi:uncharacterized delta-60 repeat protein
MNKLLRLFKNGNLDTSFNVANATADYTDTLPLSNGKLLVCGINLITMRRLNFDGSIDTTFSGASTNSTVRRFIKQSDDKLVCVGDFTTVSGISYNKICRLNANGTLDTTFNIGTGFNGNLHSIEQQSDGKLLIGGNFTSYSGFSSPTIIRLNSDGTIDTTFTSPYGSAGNIIYDIAVDSTGKIYLGKGTSFRKLNANGSFDGTFSAGTLDTGKEIRALEIEPTTNKIFVGGDFETYNGFSQKGLIKLNTDGTKDSSYDIGAGFNTNVASKGPNVIRLKYNGDVYIGGFFDSYYGQSYLNLVETLPTGEPFTCDLGPCYLFSATKNPRAVQGRAKIRDCNGIISDIRVEDTFTQYFCATQILDTSFGTITISGGTDLATDCCWCFENIGSTGFLQYMDCNGNIANEVITSGQVISAKYIILQEAPNMRQLSPCPVLTPTPTITPSITPTKTPTPQITSTTTQTPSPTITQTMTQTPSQTTTQTPSSTFCYEPKAYLLLDAASGSTALSNWMKSFGFTGTSFQGMNLGFPISTVQSTFEAQMNAYISYTGYGNTTFYIEDEPIVSTTQLEHYPEQLWSSTNVWNTWFVPTCPFCDNGSWTTWNGAALNSTLYNKTFYYSGSNIPQGYYKILTTYTASNMRSNTEIAYQLIDTLVCPSSPTPTPTLTKTPTMTPSQTMTQTPSMTPSPTSAITTCAIAEIRTDASLNIPITGVEVNSIPMTYLSGDTFTITPSDPPGYYGTFQTGSTNEVRVYYGSNIAGQNITILDCDSVSQCCDLNPGGGICVFNNVNILCGCQFTITGSDGSCI